MKQNEKGEVKHELWIKTTLFKNECTELSGLENKTAA